MPSSVFESLLHPVQGTRLPEWDRVAEGLHRLRVSAGQVVFAQGVEHPHVYAVRSGLLKLCYLNDDGDEWVKSFAHEGRFFASLAALPAGGRTHFMVEALEPSVLERLPYALLTDLADRHLAWARALQALTLVFAARKEERERELLTLNPEQRYRAFRAAHPELEARIPQKDLARHLALTPVGLNRIVMRVRRSEGR